jgi:hypothetical protein
MLNVSRPEIVYFLFASVTARPIRCGGSDINYMAAVQHCYVTSYQGPDRGVLVSLAQEQFGHFPLGLYDEQMANPPPSL